MSDVLIPSYTINFTIYNIKILNFTTSNLKILNFTQWWLQEFISEGSLRNLNLIKKELKYIELLIRKKKYKYMKFYNFLLRVFIFWICYIIVHYQLLLSIIFNMGRCDNFILLNLYNIFIFMHLSLCICHCFYKNIQN